jgi:ubiquinone/menaquinone biosynthesis C-methylase UbiE
VPKSLKVFWTLTGNCISSDPGVLFESCPFLGEIKLSSGKWDFDKEAAAWDKNPGRVKLANDIADAIASEGILRPDMDVLDFGCGTGLLTLRLEPMVHSVTGVDSSRGMLDVLQSKIERHQLAKVKTRYLSTEKGDVLEGSFDAVVTAMTLHHVKDIRPLLDQFHKIIVPQGYLAMADLDPDDGEFHGDNDTVFHNGLDRTGLNLSVKEAGFEDITDRTGANVTKPSPDGTMRSFSVFLMIGRKR